MNLIKQYEKILFVLLMFTCISIFGNIEVVNAESYYLVKVNKDGTRVNLNKMTNDLNNAVEEMNKIETDLNSMPSVAMDSIYGKIVNTKYGLVKISGYQHVYDSYLNTSTRTYINSNGNKDYDGAFLGSMRNGRIYTMISSNKGWISEHIDSVSESHYSEIIPLSRVTSPSYYTVSNGELRHYYSNDLTPKNADGGIYAANVLGKAPLEMKDGRYYSYDGIYFYTSLVTMLDDYKAGHNKSAVNNKLPYYNYYQYLPFRTRTSITAEDFNRYLASKNLSSSVIESKGDKFIEAGTNNSVNAAYLFSVACHESAFGTSQIAKTKNNLFGIKVYDSSTGSGTTYNTVEDCINTASKYIFSLGYADAAGDSRYYGAYLGNKEGGMNVKYASDPYWGEIIASRYYALDKFAGFKDYNKEIIGIKQIRESVNVRKSPNMSAQTVYRMQNNIAGYLIKDMPLTLVESIQGQSVDGNNIWYKVRSDTILDKDKNIIDLFTNINAIYNFDDPYLYVHSSNIYRANQNLACLHVYGEWKITKEPTCTEDGNKTKTCMFCNVSQTESISKLGHLPSELKVTKEPTCTEDGENQITCTRCNEIIEKNKIEKLGHDFAEWTITKKPTEKEEGEKQSTCTRCGEIQKVSIPVVTTYEEKSGLQHLESFKYNDKTKRLEIQGFIAIKGINNTEDKKYSIEFVNDITNEKTTFNLVPQKTGYPFEVPSEDGKDLKSSWYTGEVNLETIKEGDYTAYIIAKQDKYMTRQILSNLFSKSITKKAEQDGRGYTFITNYFNKLVPIEISIRNRGLISFKQPPTDVSMFNTIYDINFEKNKLRILGTSFNVGASYSKNDNIKRQIVFENTSTYERYTYDATYVENGPYKVVLTLPDNMSKDLVWFDEKIDISDLPKGKYSIYMRTYTNTVDDSSELNDIFMTDLSSKKLTVEDKKYTLNLNSNKKYRVELNIL